MRKTLSVYKKSPVLLFFLLLVIFPWTNSSKEDDTTTVESVEDSAEGNPVHNGESDCASVCILEPDGGPCARYGKKFRRWAFYFEEKECKPLYYGGCKGNSNRFWTKAECEIECQDCMKTSTSSPTSASKEN